MKPYIIVSWYYIIFVFVLYQWNMCDTMNIYKILYDTSIYHCIGII